MKKKILVIVGIGDVFEKSYLDAFSQLKTKGILNDFEIYCVDSESYWVGNSPQETEEIREKRINTKNKLEQCGYIFVDKFKSEAEIDSITDKSKGKETFDYLVTANARLVIIATPDSVHVDDTIKWLNGNCERIIIEKPLTDKSEKLKLLFRKTDKEFEEIRQLFSTRYSNQENEDKIEQLLYLTTENRVFCLNHYRGKIHKELTDGLWVRIFNELQDIAKLSFYLLEDHSGTDESHLENLRNKNIKHFPSRIGPIEILLREKALESGILLDLLSHMMPVIKYFCDINTIEVTKTWAAKYVGVDGDYAEEAKINGETFAKVEFESECVSENNPAIKGIAYIGKGIRGAKNFPDLEGNVKLLEIESSNGKKVQILFNQKEFKLIDNEEVIFLETNVDNNNPYSYLIETAFSKDEVDLKDTIRLPYLLLEEGIQSLFIIENIKDKIEDKIRNKTLPTYKLGKGQNAKDGEPEFPPYLEELEAQLGEPLWDRLRDN